MAPSRRLDRHTENRNRIMAERSLTETPFQRPQRIRAGGGRVVSTENSVELSDFEVLSSDETPEFPRTDTSLGQSFRTRMELMGLRLRDQTPHPLTPAAPQPETISVDFENTTSTRARSVDRPTGYWKLRNGKFIPIISMDNQHLESIILMCQRNALNRGRRLDENSPGVYQELTQERNRRNIARVADLRVSQFIRIQPSSGRILFDEMTPPLQTRQAELARHSSQTTGRDVRFGPTLGFGYDPAGGVWSSPEPAPSIIPDGAPKRRIKS